MRHTAHRIMRASRPSRYPPSMRSLHTSLLALPLLAGLSACSWVTLTPTTYCDDDDGMLVDGEAGLSCEDASVALEHTRMIAGRPVGSTDANLILGEIKGAWQRDATATRAVLDRLKSERDAMRRSVGLDVAELRATHAWEALAGEGPLDPETFPRSHDSVKRRIAPWAQDDDEKLVLTEADIESWIRYASLCREVQAGGPLKLSISNREQLYRDMVSRFETSDRAGQIGLVGLGGFWPSIESRWQAASYEQQQRWITQAPLPPPMTGTSMGYASVIFEDDLAKHAAILHKTLGPFTLEDR